MLRLLPTPLFMRLTCTSLVCWSLLGNSTLAAETSALASDITAQRALFKQTYADLKAGPCERIRCIRGWNTLTLI